MKAEPKERIAPFVLNTRDDFSIVVADRNHLLLGQQSVALTNSTDRIYTISYRMSSHLAAPIFQDN